MYTHLKPLIKKKEELMKENESIVEKNVITLDIKEDIKSNPNNLVSVVCKYMQPQLDYMSTEAIEKNIRDAFEYFFKAKGIYKRVTVFSYTKCKTVKEVRQVKAIPKKQQKMLDYFESIVALDDREALIVYVYECILSSEGMPSTLTR